MNPDNGNLDDKDLGKLSIAFVYANNLARDIFTVVRYRWGKQANWEELYNQIKLIKHYLDLVYKPEGESTNDRSSY